MRVLVTGGTGFVGGAVVRHLAKEAWLETRAAVRSDAPELLPLCEVLRVGELSSDTKWSDALHGVELVVHAAARAHVMRERERDPRAAFRRVNVEGTLGLARQAARAGVSRFVFISSVKVHGDATLPGRPFTVGDSPAPVDAYGASKREAEDALRVIAAETGMNVVVIRPVMVYGPGVKGNFNTLLRWLARGVPLPFKTVRNRRSLVAIGNLVDLIALSLRHPAAANRTLLVSDGDDLSTPELCERVGKALGREARMFALPNAVLRGIGHLTRQEIMVNRLLASLQVDITNTCAALGWKPIVSVESTLAATAQAYLSIRES